VVLATTDQPGLSVETVGSAKVYRAEIQNFYWQFRNTLPGKLIRAAWHWRDRNNPEMGRVVRDVIAAEKPDVISFHNIAGFSIAAWYAAFSLRVPSMQVLHDLYLMCPSASAFKGGKACLRRCPECVFFRREHVKASRQLSEVVGVSHFVLNKLTEEGFFKGVRQDVIHNARVIPDVTRPAKLPDDLVFGYIGSINPAKGLEWLVKEFRRSGDGAKLLIAGEGSESFKARLRKLAGGSNIEFLGYVRSDTLFREIDVAIVPSIWPDTLPGVAYEACAYHVPVIASQNGGLPEIIKNRTNGLLCNSLEPQSLGEAITELMNDRGLLQRLSSQCRASVREYLDFSHMLDEYERILFSIYSKR
jgi:glycosyltransferase involved in cell wall biosynthesis